MSKTTLLSLPILALAIAAGAAFAQTPEAPKSPEPSKFYKLEFVVQEVEGGKALNSRSYSTQAASDARDGASIRAGSKMPIATGGQANQFTYIDVGVNIDCRSIRIPSTRSHCSSQPRSAVCRRIHRRPHRPERSSAHHSSEPVEFLGRRPAE